MGEVVRVTAPTAAERLRLIARSCIVKAKGDTGKALEALQAILDKEKDAALERALTESYRVMAMRALLAVHYNELRAEGRIRVVETRIPTTDYERPKPTSWARKFVQEHDEKRRSLLDTFHINGVALGDCTREQLETRIERNEREARFLTAVVNGLPPGGRVRDYVKPEEADQYWEQAAEKRVSFEVDPIWQRVWPWIMKGLKQKDLAEAEAMAATLREINPAEGTPQRVLLLALARSIKEYEDAL